MRHKISDLLAAVHGCLLVLLIFLPIVTIIYPEQKDFWYRGLLVILPAAASSWGIRHIRRLTVYLGLGILIAAALFFAGTTLPEQAYLTFAAALVFLCRIPARLHQSRDLLDSPNVLCLIAFAVIYIAGTFISQSSLCEISYRLAFCDIIILILHTNLTGLIQFLEQNRDMANLPGKQIIRTNQVMLTFFLAAALVAMLLLPATGLSNALSMLGDGLLWLIRKLFSLIPSSKETAIEATEAVAEAVSNEFMALPEDNTPAWLTALLNFIAYALGTILLIAVVIGIIFAIIQVFRRFYRPILENNDKQEFIHEEKADIMARAPGKQKEASLRFRFQPDAVIRRIYKKAIKRGLRNESRKNAIQKSDTPSQLERKASFASDEPERLLHQLYEKARYSDEECTREEVNRLKSTGYK